MEAEKSQLDSSKEKMKKKKHYFRNSYCMASKFTLYVHKHLESYLPKFHIRRATNTGVIGVFLATVFKASNKNRPPVYIICIKYIFIFVLHT